MFPLLAAMASSCTGIETGRAAETRAMAIPAWTCFKGRLKHARRWTIATSPTAAEVYCFLARAGRKKKIGHCIACSVAAHRIAFAWHYHRRAAAFGTAALRWRLSGSRGLTAGVAPRLPPVAGRCRPAVVRWATAAAVGAPTEAQAPP